MGSFKEEAKKKNLGKYYCKILKILVIQIYSPSQTQMYDGEYEGSEDKTKMGDESNNPGDV